MSTYTGPELSDNYARFLHGHLRPDAGSDIKRKMLQMILAGYEHPEDIKRVERDIQSLSELGDHAIKRAADSEAV